MTPELKIGLAQSNPTIGDLDGNLATILQRVQLAEKQGLDLLVFPELSLTGYPPRDLLFESDFVSRQLEALGKVEKASSKVAVFLGFVEPNPEATGRPFYNALAVFHQGRRIATYRKRLLPYYDVFDEPRYFEAGASPSVVEVSGKRIGLAICEDIWNEKGFLNRLYAADPMSDLEEAALDLVVVPSASPFHLFKNQARERLLTQVSRRLNAPVAFCNQVGGNDELLFDGCSALVKGDAVLAAGPAFEEALVIGTLSSTAAATHPAYPETEAAWVLSALEMGIRDYVRKCRASNVVVGVSGGIDSAVVVALAVRALGKEHVYALSLPTRYTSSGSKSDARLLCESIGVSFQELSIEPLFEKYRALWPEWFGHSLQGVALENVQPRIRMTLLMALANEKGALLLNTSNKSEISTGYATLYGDSAGALAVLGDLTKSQVYAVARELNKLGMRIPEGILKRAPSAELREDQTDSQSLPEYDVLDALVEERVVQVMANGESPAGAKTLFSRLYSGSEFKRAQLPPVLRVSRKAFGTGRRFPIAKR
ncbi:MAG: NAD+ synthase [Bdellovibrionaceae bacterium]|nr:NAD+ synthase [Bdellovibrionales bacterium]MCB9253706.1 NAD+ synthase [Pseudobdellovibrionaceae bacterium]